MSRIRKIRNDLEQHRTDIKNKGIEVNTLQNKMASDLESSNLGQSSFEAISLINKKIKEYYLDLQQHIKGIKGICEQLKYNNTSDTLGKSISDIDNYVSDYEQLANAINDATDNVWQDLQTEKQKILKDYSELVDDIVGLMGQADDYIGVYDKYYELAIENYGTAEFNGYKMSYEVALDSANKKLLEIKEKLTSVDNVIKELTTLLDEKGMSKSALAVAATSGINGAVSGTTVTHSASGALAGATVKPSAKWFNTIN